MNNFITPLVVKSLPRKRFKLLEEFTFHTKNDEVITVPKGFITDMASIPRIFWFILPPNGKYGKAAVIHDYLYTNAIRNKKYADDIFLEGMKALRVNRLIRTIMYYAVRLFGSGKY